MTSKNKGIWRYLEVFSLIIVSVTPWIPQIIKLMLLAILIVFNFKYIWVQGRTFVISLSLVLLLLVFVIPSVLDIMNITSGNPYSLTNFLYPFNFICGYVIACKYGKEEFCIKIEKVIFIVAVLSLVGMSVYYINPSAIYSFPSYTYYGAENHTLYFFNYQFTDGWMSMRNAGIAWEPGVFQILLNIGLCISIRKEKSRRLLFKVIIYIIAIVLTRSTMGFCILLFNIILLLKKDKRYWVVLFFAAVAFSTLIISELQFQLSNKLVGSESFEYRYLPLVNAIKYTWNKPFGIGSTEYNAIYEQMNLGSFDAYTQILMRYGYPLLIYIIVKLIQLIKKDHLLGIIIILALFSSPVWGSAFFIVFYFFHEKGEKADASRLER